MSLRRLFNRDSSRLNPIGDLADADIEKALAMMISEASEANYRNLRNVARRLRRQDRRTRSGFEKRLMQRWGKGIHLYDVFLIAARQFGEDYNLEHRPNAVANQDYVFEALTRIHARTCLIASEIRALIISGHASGALARWRSLHELAVVAFFLNEHGNVVAERYLLHEIIQIAKQSDKYELHHQSLGMAPQDPSERQRLLDSRKELSDRFGRFFASDYGWASGVLQGNPTFDRIEESVGLAHWRPYFGMASGSIHAGYRSMTFDIGHMATVGPKEIMLAGPSNAGLTDPGHSAVISLMNCTVALLTLEPTPESLVELKILQRLVDEVGEAFADAHDRLEKDEARYGVTNRAANLAS